METISLWVLAGVFAVVNGANDGSTLIANGLKIASARPLTAILLLVTAVAIVPFAIGSEVATTLVDRLVDLEGTQGKITVSVALAAAIVVTTALTRLGLPTSLTLALIGGLAGAGAGAGLPVAWSTVALVLVIAAVAPLVGGGLAFLLAAIPLRTPGRLRADQAVAALHRIGFVLQCLGYGANDGQKIVAVGAVAMGVTAAGFASNPLAMAGVAALFLVGILISLRRMAQTMGSGVVATRPYDSAMAGISSAAAVLTTAAVGAPVSTTQSTAGALVGAAARRSPRSVRWNIVARLGGAWGLTLPCSGLLAFATTALVAALG
ncbi:MAG TPA: inorganic phosphate transporter [Acidimicrobiia bacterium]|nr:inorganic phosphate transporter [Acidimicrobiia bacterium]